MRVKVPCRLFTYVPAMLAMTAAFSVATLADTPYYGEVRTLGEQFCPSGWLPLDGRLLQISENDTLFSLIGTRYGGDGQENFALPAAKPDHTLTPGLPMVQCISLFGVYPAQN